MKNGQEQTRIEDDSGDEEQVSFYCFPSKREKTPTQHDQKI